MSLGECSDYTNTPEPQIGTIMSYCHTWPIQDGGGITMKFDPLINNVITAYVAVQDLDDCNEEYNLGCIDPFACNFDPLANTNDGSCNYETSSYDTIVANTVILWNTMYLGSSGDYSFILVNSSGCDSIANINFTLNTTSSDNITSYKENILIKAVDVLGREIDARYKGPFFYIYEDGRVEKRIIVE